MLNLLKMRNAISEEPQKKPWKLLPMIGRGTSMAVRFYSAFLLSFFTRITNAASAAAPRAP